MVLQKNILEQPGVFQSFYKNHPDGIVFLDENGRIMEVNDSALNMFGYTREELLEDLDQLLNWSSLVSAGIGVFRREMAIPHKKGNLLYVKLTCMPLIDNEKECGKIITFENITQYYKHRKGVLNIHEMFTLISEKSQNIISAFTNDGVFTYISPTVNTLLGYTQEEVIGQPQVLFNHPDDFKRLKDVQNTYIIDQDTVRFTGRVLHKNGEYRWYETTVEMIRDESGEIVEKICVGRDVTDRIEAEKTISHLAYHDAVTDLPNRRLFKKEAEKLLQESKSKVHCLMLLDLDGFKHVNDNFGHEIGDLLLIEVGKRLTNAVGEAGLVARWGGDEFTIICGNIKNKINVHCLIEKIEAEIAKPILIAGNQLFIGVSIGFALTTEFGSTMEELLKTADADMYRTKNKRK